MWQDRGGDETQLNCRFSFLKWNFELVWMIRYLIRLSANERRERVRESSLQWCKIPLEERASVCATRSPTDPNLHTVVVSGGWNIFSSLRKRDQIIVKSATLKYSSSEGLCMKKLSMRRRWCKYYSSTKLTNCKHCSLIIIFWATILYYDNRNIITMMMMIMLISSNVQDEQNTVWLHHRHYLWYLPSPSPSLVDTFYPSLPLSLRDINVSIAGHAFGAVMMDNSTVEH